MTHWANIRPCQQQNPCSHDLALGIACYLRLKGFGAMSLQVLLIYDCLLRLKELLLTKCKILCSTTPSTAPVIFKRKERLERTRAWRFDQRICVNYLYDSVSSQTWTQNCLISSANPLRRKIPELTASDLSLSWPVDSITPHAFHRGEATRLFAKRKHSFAQIKTHDRWKKEGTLYKYIQFAKVLTVEGPVKEDAKSLLQELMESLAYFSTSRKFQWGGKRHSTNITPTDPKTSRKSLYKSLQCKLWIGVTMMVQMSSTAFEAVGGCPLPSSIFLQRGRCLRDCFVSRCVWCTVTEIYNWLPHLTQVFHSSATCIRNGTCFPTGNWTQWMVVTKLETRK